MKSKFFLAFDIMRKKNMLGRDIEILIVSNHSVKNAQL